MNTISWGIVALVALVLVYISTWDEPLDPAVTEWTEAPVPAGTAEDNGYYALMGFFASADADAHAVGLHMGEAARYAAQRTTSLIMQSSPTVREAFEQMDEFVNDDVF